MTLTGNTSREHRVSGGDSRESGCSTIGNRGSEHHVSTGAPPWHHHAQRHRTRRHCHPTPADRNQIHPHRRPPRRSNPMADLAGHTTNPTSRTPHEHHRRGDHAAGAAVRREKRSRLFGGSHGHGRATSLAGSYPQPRRHRQVIWECLWRSRCEWTGWQKMVAEFVFQAAAAVMIWFQTAKRLVISVRHSGALIR